MEKYEEAAESRFDDWEILSKGETQSLFDSFGWNLYRMFVERNVMQSM